MAEYVHHQMEKMIGQFEQMQRVGIFNEKQIKALVKKRRDFEYKLVQRQKQKRHFMAYINHEICLVEVVKMKRKELGYFHKSEEIEYQIVKRINRIFDMALNRWPKDLDIWMSQAKFLIKWNMKVLLSKLCSRMLALHGHDTKLWCLAAKWELTCGQSEANCRKVFLRALETHEGSREVMVEYFRAELMFVEKRRLRLLELSNNALQDNKDEEEEDEDQEEADKDKLIMSGELARMVYKNFRQLYPDDYKWTIEFARVANLFAHVAYGRKMFDDIVSDLKSGEFGSKPETCVALAQFKLDQSADVTSVVKSLKRDVIIHKSRDMLQHYVTFLADLVTSQHDHHSDVITDEMCWVAQLCVTSPSLRMCDDVTSLLCRHLNARAHYLLSSALIGRRGESCGELAHLRTVALLGAGEELGVDDLVTSLIMTSSSSSARVRREHCEAMTCWMRTMTCDDDVTEAIVKLMKLMRNSELKFDDDLVKFVVNLLVSVFVNRGIAALRQIYRDEVLNVRNGSELFYVETIKLMKRASEDENDQDLMGKLHENSLKLHHSTSVHLWIEYLLYASSTTNNKKADSSRVYQRAVKSLKPDLVQQFVDRASLL